MNSITDYLKDHAAEFVLGALIALVLVYYLLPQFAPAQGPYQQQLPQTQAPPDFPRRRIPPWHPGAPRNPRECVARGGVDMGAWCHHYH